MAIAFDNKTRATASFTTISFATSGTDRALVVIVESGGVDNVAATYNSVSLTKQGTITDIGGNRLTLLTLINPASGTNTLNITGQSLNEALVASYTGVGSVSGYNTGQNSGVSSLTVTFTVTSADSWVASGGLGRAGPGKMNASTGVSNVRYDGTTSPTSLYVSWGDSGPHSTDRSHTWTNTTTNVENTVMGLVLVPPGAAGPTTVKTVDGVTVSTQLKTLDAVALASIKSINGNT